MNIKDAQSLVNTWISQWESGYWSPLSNLARLTEEMGELARTLNLREGDKPAKSNESPPSRDDLTEEFGDLLFTLLVLANSLDIDLTEALNAAIEKYDIRDDTRHD